VKATVVQAMHLFNTDFSVFRHDETGRKVTAHVGPAHIPTHLDGLVRFVDGLSAFPVGAKGRLGHSSRGTHVETAAGGQYTITAPTYPSIYGTPGANFVPAAAGSQNVVQFEAQTYSPEGITGYAANVKWPMRLPTAQTTVGPETDSAQIEAQLDVTAQGAIGTGVEQWFWLEDGSKWMLSFTTEFFNTTVVPLVNSISYAWSELDQCGSATSPYDCNTFGVNSEQLVAATNTNFQKIGLRGVSVMVASGDSGVYGRTAENCVGPQFRPDFPACSPWVTSVGGTYTPSPTYFPAGQPVCGAQCLSGGTEAAVSYKDCGFTSGGGFSNYAPMPAYQTSAVNNYFSSGVVLPPSSYYNATNRGFPDVSAQGHNILIYVDEADSYLVGGTSAASPAFSGMVSLLNDYSLATKGKPLGFLNPLLYQLAASTPNTFTDIVTGDNKCTESGCGLYCTKGFLAYKGWDPVTGLGTPNYKNLLTALQEVLKN